MLQVENQYVFNQRIIKDLSSRLVEQQRDETIIGVWRAYIAHCEGDRCRLPPEKSAKLAVPAEVELFILEVLTTKLASDSKAGFSFLHYHTVEMEILEALGYFIKFEKG